mmetsp:Transcript_33538/g.38118  ORF Transcript_33538/g.38118 Transcript_33538/m.38118 type:complete len:234 (+) Transcript_33538:298-999(+)
MPNYGDPSYWDKRYNEQRNTTFDWLEDWAALKPILAQLGVKKDDKILMLGCGNAELSEDMYNDGYSAIYNIDISSVVIDTMKARCADTSMVWEVMDVRDLKYPDNFFDLAIDKSTIDALLCGDDSFVNVAKMTKEVQRTLKVNGNYMVISYGTPENRLYHFKLPHLSWDVSDFRIQSEVDDPDKYHYCYIAKKREDADLVSAKEWENVQCRLIQEEEEYEAKQGKNLAKTTQN